jgi:hypothetical protein
MSAVEWKRMSGFQNYWFCANGDIKGDKEALIHINKRKRRNNQLTIVDDNGKMVRIKIARVIMNLFNAATSKRRIVHLDADINNNAIENLCFFYSPDKDEMERRT